MQNITPPAASFTETGIRTIADASAHPSETQSALQMTRDAIARWSGRPFSAAARRDVPRISPKSRWLAQAQQDLAAWIACGGFTQIGDAANPAVLPPFTGQVMYSDITPQPRCPAACKDDAYID